MNQRARRAALRSARTTAAAVVLALLATACSGDDGQTRDGPEPAAAASEAPEVPEEAVATDLGFGAVEGRLPRAQRDALAGEVQAVVDEWIDAAYLGDYPRTDFSAAWAHFTPGARRRAERDSALMSNSDIGAQIDGVEAERRRVRLDVLAVRQRPMGVTAHVVLRFATGGSTAQQVRVAGRLYLTEGDRGWQVFGYDVTKGTV